MTIKLYNRNTYKVLLATDILILKLYGFQEQFVAARKETIVLHHYYSTVYLY